MAAQMEVPIPPFPELFKHMTLAIYKSGKVSGSDKMKFKYSIDIALANLKTNDFITKASSVANVQLTVKGKTQNKKHLVEPLSKSKERQFDTLYRNLMAEGKPKPPKLSGPQRTNEKDPP